ncbi:2-oxoacid ferredoxin oxidoreductase [Candidatus Gottesmanbacteria bacterium CG11_big_fil_rev_8_21_14_0_20_37_11]|uniref:2-oxoacid ferredoxin oxidoreductase n=3 Tax=Candidatus Gottesmaniibacteriota TaxID=1752720 RepID=A0A2M7RPQ6_9BACT|nr:MAG: hypothetical protein AUJ73_04150 [Candidatus Gottesmanbacteria bacterium CG1_02_37_22]PIP33075.1 MAG: 2-oxoacid ferredoxin oxidoreductase [Candidatus Gottesmanbacteria bacterium CG23_combo_of_CG06-09_8_20_14_all_37_19]PIR08874.1 MAG: 2-oxoacid ferredoxin oxidoreductase [Candidatus Gottesmanbacteria bacterium CG11_big_fil_rev_8_21_14_0_20_37_11]PIZ02160.1 MAG: 2-oxoacid ferredoxin oxidoreductase [Candidatus Gottesmanbacteria bacterium CG_4_10_14_0_8_um_filter_37_24]
MIQTNLYDSKSPTWCPGCGDYGIWASLRTSLNQLGWGAEKYAVVYGVGCSGNMTDFIKCHGFHSLHGRAVPNAEGIKLANHELTVICEVGDGDCYGEGGNHLLHAMRGNADIKVLVHDNRVYGLTTGQTAPTSPSGFKSKSTPQGVIELPVNPLSFAITQGASFVAQGFAGDTIYLIKLITEALSHKGFALLNILQPCVSFNKFYGYAYYKERIYRLEEDNHNPESKEEALKRVMQDETRIPLGIIYKKERPTYQDQVGVLAKGTLVKQPMNNPKEFTSLLNIFTENPL